MRKASSPYRGHLCVQSGQAGAGSNWTLWRAPRATGRQGRSRSGQTGRYALRFTCWCLKIRGTLYVACLLLEPPREPIHAVALALKAREMTGQAGGPCELVQQRSIGLDDAAAVRALWRRQRALERVLEDADAIEPVKAEALRELEEVTEFLRKSPWRSRSGAERCVEAVGKAIWRLHRHLCRAVDGAGMLHPVLQAFGRHLHEYLLIPSGRGGARGGTRLASVPGGCFT